ncbi:MAG: sugar kinase, partial [Chloroflexi bacterium]|nr:sugar kinase [Chloroflexota bacterium]
MTLLVVGSVAYDSVKTPQGAREDALGGSAMYFSIASSYFTSVSLVAVVGEDFRPEHIDLLKEHNVDVSGLERVDGDTFRWSGVYSTEDVNERETLDTQLNVFADFKPNLAEQHRNADFLFLANIDPELQLEVLGQMNQRPKLVALDSMNFWIDGKKNELDRIVEAVDMIFMDEGEARSYANETNLRRAAVRIHDAGPRIVVI